MYQSSAQPQEQQQFSPWQNQSFIPQSIIPSQPSIDPQYSLPASNLVNLPDSTIDKDRQTISDSQLINLLDDHTNKLKRLPNTDQEQQLPILIDALNILNHVQESLLASAAQNEFFSLLRIPLNDILQRWRRLSSLPDNESFIFRSMAILIRRFINAIDDIKLLPSWLSDSTLLETIADCLTDIATADKFLDDNNKDQFKQFTRLIDAYSSYQERLNDENHSNNDKLVQLLDPILQCLTSSYFLHTFTNLQIDTKSMTTIEKFFLLKCPAFLTSYNGSRLEQTMESLLSTMLPSYVILLDKLVPSANSWKRSIIRSIQHLFKIINHGADQFQINAKFISNHLSLIDHVLKLVNEPIFYNNLRETLSNPETTFMNTAINFLVNMISEPIILAHINQCQVAHIFLRLTSCQYEPLAFKVYTLLAYTMHEEDIKAMQNPGRLLAPIIQALKITLKETSNNERYKEQLLEILKGLVQHDQIKDEIFKQNLLPFLLKCMNKLTGRAQILILEILWSLTFREEGAQALRSNHNFLDKIEIISEDSNNEPLKKAVDGLVWKLIQEPAFLKKVAKREEEAEKNAGKEVMETVFEEVVSANGEKRLVATVKPVKGSTEERIFEYDMMISYCHADKELTYKVHKFLLDQGFKIWIDLDNMYGPAMNAMAEAVENSEFVIMCMSDSYKQSTYCQAEAEYAFNCKRRLLPLIIRKGYKPDGWLGFMIGSRIYVDFGRFDFETACEKLMTEITLQRKRPLPSKSAKMSQHESPMKTMPSNQEITTPLPRKSSVTNDNNVFSMYTKRKPTSNFIGKRLNDWIESDVLDFLFTQQLIELMPLCETMDGQALVQLYKMCTSRSSKVYVLLNNELKSTYNMKLPIGIYMRFLSAMEQRLIARPPSPLRTVSEFPATTVTATPQKYVLQTPATTVTATPPKYVLQTPATTVTATPPKYVLQTPATTGTTIPPKYVSQTSKTSIINSVPLQYPSYAVRSYDYLIVSDASPLEVLTAVTCYGPNFAKILSDQRRNSIQF